MPSIAPVILVVDDDPGILMFVRANLKARGFRVNTARNGEEGLEQLSLEPPALVLLDINMPVMDGLTMLQRLREWNNVPVIILSAQDDEQAKVRGLDAGADDYLTKPFGLEELLARVRVALRHASTQPEASPNTAVIEIGPIRLDQAAHRVSINQAPVELTRTEFALLRELMVHAGKVLTHRDLLQRVWGPEYGEESEYLRTFIKQLRRKIEPDPGRPRFILTEPGVGYRFDEHPA